MKNFKKVVPVLMILLISSLAIAEYVPFKVKLNMIERLVVDGLLPKETNFANWKIINDLKNQLAPTETEMKNSNMRNNPNGGVLAEWDKVEEKEIVFGEITEKLIINALKKLDSESKLLPEHLSLYEKFIVRLK